jgi:hypothetical protein
MRIVQSCLVVLLVAALLVSWSWAGGQARRVILMIGDGMGPAQVGLVLDYLRLVKGEPANMEKLAQRGNTGYMTTNPLGALVTDSAASASALATGRIYENGVISWSEDGGDVVTVLERAHAARKAVGLVTTTRLTHATPAAFAAHSLSRNTEDVIARHELVRNRVDVLLGGGSRHFEGLVDTAAMLGYTVVRTAEELRELDLSRCDKVLGLFAEGHMAYEIDRAGTDEPSLAEMTEAALARLDCDREGFFLVVEGGRIDHACHDNDAGTTLRGLLAFDEAVGVALAYADRHRGTLLLVTADHETGGMGVSPAPPNGGDGSDYQTGYGGSDRLALLGNQTDHPGRERSRYRDRAGDMGRRAGGEALLRGIQIQPPGVGRWPEHAGHLGEFGSYRHARSYLRHGAASRTVSRYSPCLRGRPPPLPGDGPETRASARVPVGRGHRVRKEVQDQREDQVGLW